MSRYLGLVPIDETSDDYQRVRKMYFFSILFAHLDVWRMYKQNRQFKKIEGVIARKAVQHCAAQAARAQVVASLIRLPLMWRNVLVKGTLLTDSFKAEERRYMNCMQRLNGSTGWDDYAKAQEMARASWEGSGLFSPAVLTVATSVAHESLIDMVKLCNRVRRYGLDSLIDLEKARLVAHYLDDISVSDEWVREPVDGRNILDIRIDNNIANTTYQKLNEEGCTRMREIALDEGIEDWPTGETTYEAQRRVGHMVERVVAGLVIQASDTRLTLPADLPINLPVFIDNLIRYHLLDLAAWRAARHRA